MDLVLLASPKASPKQNSQFIFQKISNFHVAFTNISEISKKKKIMYVFHFISSRYNFF